jgi:catechol 2,3-dioxygenase-like lactoylglutathione lyase family enzyme
MPGFTNAVPVIATQSVEKTVAWFERTLGFERQWSWGDPPVYAGILAGGAELYITEDVALFIAIEEQQLRPEIFLWVTDIDAIYAQHRARGAEITEELTTRAWGLRQYVIREPNGYLLKIAESD